MASCPITGHPQEESGSLVLIGTHIEVVENTEISPFPAFLQAKLFSQPLLVLSNLLSCPAGYNPAGKGQYEAALL